MLMIAAQRGRTIFSYIFLGTGLIAIRIIKWRLPGGPLLAARLLLGSVSAVFLSMHRLDVGNSDFLLMRWVCLTGIDVGYAFETV